MRVALGRVTLRAVYMKVDVDNHFTAAASRKETVDRG